METGLRDDGTEGKDREHVLDPEVEAEAEAHYQAVDDAVEALFAKAHAEFGGQSITGNGDGQGGNDDDGHTIPCNQRGLLPEVNG